MKVIFGYVIRCPTGVYNFILLMRYTLRIKQEGDRHPLLRAELKLAKIFHNTTEYLPLFFRYMEFILCIIFFSNHGGTSMLKPINLPQSKLSLL